MLIIGLRSKLSFQKTTSEKTKAEKIATGINDSHFVKRGGISLFLKKSMGTILGIKVAIADPKIMIHLSIVILILSSLLFIFLRII